MINKQPSSELPSVDVALYNAFVHNLKLHRIAVVETTQQALIAYWDDERPYDLSVKVLDHQINPDDPRHFACFIRVAVVFKNDEEASEEVGSARVTYVLEYTSTVECSEELLTYFEQSNVQFHVWPYAREFLQNSVSRFGWGSFILPPFVADKITSPQTTMEAATE